MIDWILAGTLRLQAQAAAHTARVRIAARVEAQEAEDREAQEARDREAREREAREAEEARLEREAQAMQALPILVGGRPVPVRVEPPVGLPPNPYGTGGGGLPWGGSGRGRDAHSQVDLAPPGDSGLGDTGLGSSLSGSYAAGSSSGSGVTVVPYRQLWGGQLLHFYELTMSTGTGFTEKFLLHIPPPSAAPADPLLVVFHKFGSTHWDVWYNTTYLQECEARNWFLVCPLGASNKSFSSLPSQLNREAVFDWLLGAFPRIDTQRVYGVGFSMGGGSLLNYAARHLDPAHLMFAALVNHTGGVDLNHTYWSDPPARFIFDFWYGDGSPGSADPWQMARSSVIWMDPLTQVVDPTTDLARHLVNIPLRSMRASNDPIAYLMTQNDVLHAHMGALGAQPKTLYGYFVLQYSSHDWNMISASAVCDFLGGYTLQIPTHGNVLADRDATYYSYSVVQDAAGAFTPFTFDVDTAANRLGITATGNLARLDVDTPATGIDPQAPFTLDLATQDGLADVVVLRSWPAAPLAVQRDGVAAAGWSFDPATGELQVSETDGAAHTWTFTP